MSHVSMPFLVAVIHDWRSVGGRDEIADFVAFRECMPAHVRTFLVGPIDQISGDAAITFVPNGSKDGWDRAIEAGEWRDKLIAFLEACRYPRYAVLHLGDNGYEEDETFLGQSSDALRRARYDAEVAGQNS